MKGRLSHLFQFTKSMYNCTQPAAPLSESKMYFFQMKKYRIKDPEYLFNSMVLLQLQNFAFQPSKCIYMHSYIRTSSFAFLIKFQRQNLSVHHPIHSHWHPQVTNHSQRRWLSHTSKKMGMYGLSTSGHPSLWLSTMAPVHVRLDLPVTKLHGRIKTFFNSRHFVPGAFSLPLLPTISTHRAVFPSIVGRPR